MISFSDKRLGRGFFIIGMTLLLLIGVLGSTVYLSASTKGDSKSNADEVKLSFTNDNSPVSNLDLDEQRVLTIGERQIDAKIHRNKQGVAVELDGDNRPLDLDFPQLATQVGHRTAGVRNLASITIMNAAGSIIENQVYSGVNISLIDSPNSIIRNNTITDILQPSSNPIAAYGIYLSNCSNSLITSNTLSNISSAVTPETANWAYGIWVKNSNDTTISGNILANISSNRDSRGIYISSDANKDIKNITIADNVFANISASLPVSVVNTAYALGIDFSINNNLNDIRIANNSFTDISAKGNNAQTYGLQVIPGNLDGMTVTNNSFTNTSSTAIGTSGTAASYDLYFDPDDEIANLTVTTNQFIATTVNGTEGASGKLFACGIYVNSGPASNLNISQNSFINGSFISSVDTDVYGMLLDIGAETNNLTIAENTFTNSSGTSYSGSASTYGLYLYLGGSNNIWLAANRFTDSSARGATATWAHGIYVEIASTDAYNVTITGNIFGNSSATSNTGNANAYGIYWYNYGHANESQIVNNTFADSSATSSAGSAWAYGIYWESNDHVNNSQITDNTFTDNSATASAHAGSYGFWLEVANFDINYVTVANNTFEHGSATSSTNFGNPKAYGIYWYTDTGHVNNSRIANNIFKNNSVTGVITTYSSGIYFEISASITNMTILGNIFASSPVLITGAGNANFWGINIGATDIVNMTLQGNTFSNSSATAILGAAASAGVVVSAGDINSTLIVNNTFTDGSASGGVNANAEGISLSAGGTIRNLSISDNAFDDIIATGGSSWATVRGLNLSPGGDNHNFTVHGNTFTNTPAISTSSAATSYGVWMESGENTTLRANKFGNVSAFSSGTVEAYGLYVEYSNGTIIAENVITSSSPAVFFDVYLRRSYNAELAFYETTVNNVTWLDASLAITGASYTLYRNGSSEDTGSWTTATKVNLTMSNLIPRVYNFTIHITNGTVSVTDTLFVTILDGFPPTVSSPDDLTIEDDSTGNNLSWDISDANAINAGFDVFIYVNGSLDDSQTGLVNTTSFYNYSLDSLPVGGYNITIVVFDSSGNFATDMVILAVQDTIAPVIVSSSGNATIEHGSTGNNVTWNATDANAGTYRILQNGSEVANGSWTSGAFISYNLEGLVVGEYNFTILVMDAFSNSVTDTLNITVQDTTPPVIASFDANITIVGGSPIVNLAWNATDLNPGTYQIWRNGTEVASGAWTSGAFISYTAEGLSAGNYNFTITVTDAFGNSVTESAIVTVTDTSTTTAGDDGDDGLVSLVIIGMAVGTVVALSAGAITIYIRRIRGG
ncbi:MAG: beta strand repeat-containing protein [Candidatus Heimdallarchaeota archaeon]